MNTMLDKTPEDREAWYDQVGQHIDRLLEDADYLIIKGSVTAAEAGQDLRLLMAGLRLRFVQEWGCEL